MNMSHVPNSENIYIEMGQAGTNQPIRFQEKNN